MLARLAVILAVLAPAGASVAQAPAAGAAAGEGGRAGAVVVAPVPGTLARPRRENPVTSVQEFVRVEGRMSSTLRGIGIVTGLPGTGDSGKELVVARPLAQIYRNNGVDLADLTELGSAKAAAIVTLSVTLPEGGGREGDQFDVRVQALHSAKSLKGGTLIVSPLLGPTPGSPVFAMADGPIVLEEDSVPTSGLIRDGARLIRDARARPVGEVFDLILRPHYRSPQFAAMIASEINDLQANLEVSDDPAAGAPDAIARVIDETTVRVAVPASERGNPAMFMARLMGRRFSPSLVDLPAMVVVNERTGSIVVTGDVEISAVTVGSDKLVITTTTPAPSPTPQDPLVTRQNWAEFGTTGTGSERARIQDLLEAFKQLNVPVREQISILAQIHRTGRLHARFVRE